eukprot:CAMPEP_0171143802 /NCGR_PEP_ID=MMETSP0766_2-20121228/144891_1 /TAXON_ID=439317 /ORGANISM="Gambierdiscus australes, Strain CAWD 149" /LENGTH=34 /DNA_ID= /DNA_START= /DNA_END= /DNA_ORIENTATION=
MKSCQNVASACRGVDENVVSDLVRFNAVGAHGQT